MTGLLRTLSFPVILLAFFFLRGEAPANLGAEREPEPKTDAELKSGTKTPTAEIGINLARASHWSSSHPFVDAIKLADDWVGGTPRDFRDERALAAEVGPARAKELVGRLAASHARARQRALADRTQVERLRARGSAPIVGIPLLEGAEEGLLLEMVRRAYRFE